MTSKLAATIYAPYKPYVRQYKSYEESTLTAALNDIPLDAGDVIDTTALLAESLPKLFAAASQVSDIIDTTALLAESLPKLFAAASQVINVIAITGHVSDFCIFL